jgi:periplasmic divalent cation tolerance protein
LAQTAGLRKNEGFFGDVFMQESDDLDILSVTTTVGSPDAARALAREILAQRLAACVQVEAGITSLYRWQGELCEETEVRLVIKSLPGCTAALEALFAKHHPYEVPQFLAQRMSASPAYANWARAETLVPAGNS